MYLIGLSERRHESKTYFIHVGNSQGFRDTMLIFETEGLTSGGRVGVR